MEKMKDPLQAFIRDAKTRGMSERSMESYLNDLQSFERYMTAARRDITKANKMDIRDYVDTLRSRGCITKTVAHHLQALHSLYEYLIFEEVLEVNPVDEVRRRYLSSYKRDGESHTHKLISIEDAARLIDALLDVRDKTLLLLLFKTGMRRGELLSLDVDDVDLVDQSILLKKTKKRSNRTVYFDNEAARYLKRWLTLREERQNGSRALFIGPSGKRMSKSAVHYTIVKAATRIGLHDPSSDRMEDHFSPHCCRHWLVTHLLRAGMPREHVKWIRGDSMRDAIDLYYHIDPKDVKESYLAHVPQLGV